MVGNSVKGIHVVKQVGAVLVQHATLALYLCSCQHGRVECVLTAPADVVCKFCQRHTHIIYEPAHGSVVCIFSS